VGPDRQPTPNTPRWVKVFVIVALAVVLLFVIAALTGRGGHGPGRHTAFDDGPRGQTRP